MKAWFGAALGNMLCCLCILSANTTVQHAPLHVCADRQQAAVLSSRTWVAFLLLAKARISTDVHL